MTPASDYLAQPFRAFLDDLAASRPAPSGGAAAALAVAMAAGLCAMAARLSRSQLPDAADHVARAETLRARAGDLAQADSSAYTRVLNARRDGDARRVRAALSEATDVPLSLAVAAAEVAALSARLAERGNPALRGDVAAAALLAEAGCRAAATLVRINTGGHDERAGRVVALADRATACARRAVAAAGEQGAAGD